MVLFLIGLLLFLGIHSVSIVAPQWRLAQVERRGAGAWKGLYSVVSLLGFLLMLYGYGLARTSPAMLWTPPAFLRHVTWLLMLPVFPLLLAAYLPGRIRVVTKHPMLLAVKIWATAHLLANGSWVDVVLFGSFLAWAVLDRISLKRRDAALAPRAASGWTLNDTLSIVIGLVLYGVFVVWGHRWVVGVAPMA